MSELLSVSVLILADHHSQKLERAVSSAAWAQEVVIGWTASEKASSDVLQNLRQIVPSLRVVHLPGEITDFPATRNKLQLAATQDWVFWLDSDEVIQSESIRCIEQVCHSDSYGGAYIRRQDVFQGRVLQWGEVRNVRILRLFHKSAGMFVRPVHEVAIVEGEIADPGIIVEHFAHDSVASFIAKVNRYAQIEAKLRYEQGRRTSTGELIAWPTGKFLQNVFFRFAFLDGWRGVAYALIMSIHSLAVRANLMELMQTNAQTDNDN